MEILLVIFVIALFIGLSNGVKRICRRYIEKQNGAKTTKEDRANGR